MCIYLPAQGKESDRLELFACAYKDDHDEAPWNCVSQAGVNASRKDSRLLIRRDIVSVPFQQATVPR